jgi:hypothetical protein
MRIELQLSQRGDVSAKDATKSLGKCSLLLAPGLLGGMLAYVRYPPLDTGILVTLALGLVSLPLLLQVRSTFRKQLSNDAAWLRTVYVYSSLGLALFAALLLLNGWLDKSPRNLLRTTLIQKKATMGRSGTRYVLTVSSWRPGRSVEEFAVGVSEFNRADVGKTVTVELHKGFFGLPWSGNISPD